MEFWYNYEIMGLQSRRRWISPTTALINDASGKSVASVLAKDRVNALLDRAAALKQRARRK